MTRRRFLAVVAGSLPLAGCITAGSSPTTDETVTPASPPTVDASTTESPRTEPTPGPARPSDTFVLGESVGEIAPLGVTLRSRASSERTVRLRITDTVNSELLLEETYTVTSGAPVEGEIRPPSDYEIRATVPNAWTETVETVDKELFDSCNSYGTTITIDHGGNIDAETFTTLVLCDPDVTVTDE